MTYNWINDRKFSSSKNFSSFYFTAKNNNLIKTSFDSFNFNKLPVIKEENGSLSDDTETQSPEKILPNTLFRNISPKKNILYENSSKESSENQDKIKEAKTFTKLPPLLNINCLMNTEIKQSHHIWNTNFGKRLIQGKSENSNFEKINLHCTKEVISSKNKKENGKFKNELLKFPSKRSVQSIAEQYGANGGGDTTDVIHKKTCKKKIKKSNKSKQNSSKEFRKEKEFFKDNLKINDEKSNEKIIRSSSKEKILCEPVSKEFLSRDDSMEVAPTVSSFSRNRHFLTECVRSILDSTPDHLECELCKEQLPNIEELCKHKKMHESKKEVCLLCEKVFYNPNEFVKHLLCHEGVDQFSCKKCKKYFPTLKKYKQHCQDFHFLPGKANYQSQASLEYVKRWLPKFECQRCKLEFNSDKELEEHKRYHTKIDLAGAYLLSPKNM